MIPVYLNGFTKRSLQLLDAARTQFINYAVLWNYSTQAYDFIKSIKIRKKNQQKTIEHLWQFFFEWQS